MAQTTVETPKLDRRDFVSDQAVRWCPGCGDYAILSQTQKTFPDLGVDKEKFVFISGIGCSSRFPYYMNAYGFHTIHGRAPAIASGVKLANPELSVWVITGDGDALSIGGNHSIHLLRRNLDINVMLFNNRIYGLTKGQYSPTSELGKITKSTPLGSLDRPFNPLALALGAQASFVARAIDRETTHLRTMIQRAHSHSGTSFIEIYQNCNIFNDGAFAPMTEKETKADKVLWLENNKPLVFGAEMNKGIRLDGNVPKVVDIDDKWSTDDLLVHDETDWTIAMILSHFTYQDEFPGPIGVLYAVDEPIYEVMLAEQIEFAKKNKGAGDIQTLLDGADNWVVE